MMFDKNSYLKSKSRTSFIIRAKKRNGINPKEQFSGTIYIGELVFPPHLIGEKIRIKMELVNDNL